MKKCCVLLSSVSCVKEFVEIVTHCDYDIDLSSGRHFVDAKSIMGIFSLDLSKPIELIAHTDNADELFTKLEKFKA
ncbi:MAG: HPr family phosphocarrier protein [Ruminococcaceae bacterium]|nr:HPr family phosphocarrier protein [Oscillospiraceae bacterium]